MIASIGSGGLLDLTKNHGSDQHAASLERCEIGRYHEFGRAEELSHTRRRVFAESSVPCRYRSASRLYGNA